MREATSIDATSVKETAEDFGYHEQSFRRLIREGKVKPPRRLYPGGKPFYTHEDRREMAEAAKRESLVEEVA